MNKESLGRFLINNFRFLYAVIQSIRSYYYFSITNKHFLSCLKWSSVTKNGVSPWFTYPAIDYLDSIDLSTKDIFEYGSGNSTIYFKKRSNSIVSVENNIEWFNKLNMNEIIYKNKKNEYINGIGKNKYDIIVIDGSYRKECAEKALNNLKKNGFIIFDDTHDHKLGIKLLSKHFFRIDFIGFLPITSQRSSTSFFFKK